jgi:Na+/citrate or Na+/malate symporter
MTAPPPIRTTHWLDRIPLIGGITLAAIFLAARVLVELTSLPLAVRISIAVLPVAIFIVWVAACVRAARRMDDELERRIQLEALAFAFPCAFAVIMGLGLLELVVTLPKHDLSYRHVWAMLPIFYLIGLTIARRRYA